MYIMLSDITCQARFVLCYVLLRSQTGQFTLSIQDYFTHNLTIKQIISIENGSCDTCNWKKNYLRDKISD